MLQGKLAQQLLLSCSKVLAAVTGSLSCRKRWELLLLREYWLHLLLHDVTGPKYQLCKWEEAAVLHGAACFSVQGVPRSHMSLALLPLLRVLFVCLRSVGTALHC